MALLGVILIGLVIMGLNRYLARFRGLPVLSAFTLYLIGVVIAGGVAYFVGAALGQLLVPLFGTVDAPGVLRSDIVMQIVYVLAVLIAGAFAGEVSFLFGLPVLTLGSDYFGIATLGFTIVVNTLMVNSDTILPFPEMKGGRGMIGIPQQTTWFWAFAFLLLVIVIMRNVVHSSTGRAIMSVREDETASKAMGINVANYKLLAFVVGSFFAGIGGGVYAHYIGFLSPGTFDFLAGFNPLIIIVFGGLGSMTGNRRGGLRLDLLPRRVAARVAGPTGHRGPHLALCALSDHPLAHDVVAPAGVCMGKVEWGFFKAADIKPGEKGPSGTAGQSISPGGGR